MNVIGYCRVSTGVQTEHDSLGTQERSCRGQALILGHDSVTMFIERGVSGSIPLAQRPAGARMLAQMQRGDLVIVPYFDRMFRDALDALQSLKWFEANGITLHIMDLGGDVLNSPFAKAYFTIIAALATLRREEIIGRVKDSKKDQKARGRYLGGAVPFGHVVDDAGAIVAEPWLADTLARARELRGRGESLRGVARTLTKQGLPVSYVTLGKALKEAA